MHLGKEEEDEDEEGIFLPVCNDLVVYCQHGLSLSHTHTIYTVPRFQAGEEPSAWRMLNLTISGDWGTTRSRV